MEAGTTTCWTLIDGAARGRLQAREEFSRRYQPILRAYLLRRWGGTPRSQDVDDAAQEVFVECFRQRGVLERTDRSRAGGFRAFLYGVTRNVARRYETRAAQSREHQADSQVLAAVSADDPTLSRVFDRAWALALIREALARLDQAPSTAEAATEPDSTARRQVELLRLRFSENLPIRDIATRWEVDAALLHRDYAKARAAFRKALVSVVGEHHPGVSELVLERECARLLELM